MINYPIHNKAGEWGSSSRWVLYKYVKIETMENDDISKSMKRNIEY